MFIHDLPNDLRRRILGNQEIFENLNFQVETFSKKSFQEIKFCQQQSKSAQKQIPNFSSFVLFYWISLLCSIVMLCTIWYHLQNLKNVKNAHGGVLLLVKLQAETFFPLYQVEESTLWVHCVFQFILEIYLTIIYLVKLARFFSGPSLLVQRTLCQEPSVFMFIDWFGLGTGAKFLILIFQLFLNSLPVLEITVNLLFYFKAFI